MVFTMLWVVLFPALSFSASLDVKKVQEFVVRDVEDMLHCKFDPLRGRLLEKIKTKDYNYLTVSRYEILQIKGQNLVDKLDEYKIILRFWFSDPDQIAYRFRAPRENLDPNNLGYVDVFSVVEVKKNKITWDEKGKFFHPYVLAACAKELEQLQSPPKVVSLPSKTIAPKEKQFSSIPSSTPQTMSNPVVKPIAQEINPVVSSGWLVLKNKERSVGFLFLGFGLFFMVGGVFLIRKRRNRISWGGVLLTAGLASLLVGGVLLVRNYKKRNHPHHKLSASQPSQKVAPDFTEMDRTALAFLKKKIEDSIRGQGLDTFDDYYLDNDFSHDEPYLIQRYKILELMVDPDQNPPLSDERNDPLSEEPGRYYTATVQFEVIESISQTKHEIVNAWEIFHIRMLPIPLQEKIRIKYLYKKSWDHQVCQWIHRFQRLFLFPSTGGWRPIFEVEPAKPKVKWVEK